MRSRLRRRIAALEALEAAGRPVAPLMLPIAVVDLDDDGQVLRVVREVPARPATWPPDYFAAVADLGDEGDPYVALDGDTTRAGDGDDARALA